MYRLFFLCFICLVSCQNKNENYAIFTPPIKQNTEPDGRYFVDEHPYSPNNPIGIYYSSSSFMHSARLQINDDNTFEFLSRGCTGANEAKGNWKQISNKIILQSFTKSKKKIEQKMALEKKVIKNSDDKVEKDKLLDEWLKNNSTFPKDLELSFNREIEINKWELKVGKGFLISEKKGNSTVAIVYKKINQDNSPKLSQKQSN